MLSTFAHNLQGGEVEEGKSKKAVVAREEEREKERELGCLE